MNEIVKNSALKNDFNGNLNYDVPIILEEAENGFPLEQYNPGHSYAAGSSANFWKESYNTFRITSGVVNFSGNNFKARHWNFLEDFGNIGRVKIIGNQQTAFFKPVTSLIVNNYLEGGSGGNYDVTWQNPLPDPITENWQFGTVYNAFEFNLTDQDRYTIEAITPMQSLGTAWYFYKWNDGSTNNIKSNLQITAPTSFTAYYKGIQRSDDSDAYANNSQRKFVRTDDGWLHSVYCSLGRVWYETSSNNGVTWTLANNGQPLDNGEGKLPSIDYSIYYGGQEDYYQVLVVFQEKSGSSSKIKIKYFQSLGGGGPYVPIYEAEAGSVQGDYYSINATPVIGVHSNYFTVVWKRTNDLYARAGHINIPGSITWDSGNALTGTTSNSINPTVSFSKTFYSNQKLAWEEVSGSISSIKYASLAGSQISGSIHTPSADNGFTMNYQPSIIELNGGARLCWIAYRKGAELDGGEGSGGELPAGTTKVFFRSYSNDVWSAFNSYGNNMNTVSINKNDNNTFAFAWSEGSSNVNKYVRSDNLTGIYNTNTTG